MCIAENVLHLTQLSNSKDAQSMLLNIFNKLYQNLKLYGEDFQNISQHFKIKEIFSILVQSLHQVELIARNVKDQGSVDFKPKPSPVQEKYLSF